VPRSKSWSNPDRDRALLQFAAPVNSLSTYCLKTLSSTISYLTSFARRSMSAVATKRPEWIDILNHELELQPKFKCRSKFSYS
jgi:hypothetical protein